MSQLYQINLNPKMSYAGLPLNKILEGKSNATHYPGYLRISLLEECNERCFFCHNEGYNSREKYINENVMWKAIDASLSLGKNKFKFTGGEPTAHPKIVEYVTKLRSKMPVGEIGIVTNATYMEKLAKPLKKAGLDTVIVSIHSLDRKNYKKITQLDALDDALKGFDAMDQQDFDKVTINMVVSTLNYHEVPAMKCFAQKRGYNLRLLDILPTNENMRRVCVPNAQLNEDYPDIAVKPKAFHEKCEGCSAKDKCGEGEYLRLSASGSLDPCMYREDLKIKLESSDTPKIMQKKLALGFRRIIKDTL